MRTLPFLLALLLPAAALAGPAEKRWLSKDFSFRLAGMQVLPHDAVNSALQASLRAWTEVGAGPLVALEPGEGRAEARLDGVNSIFFVTQDWPSRPEELALTYTHVDASTREILEVDIAINAAHHVFATESDPRAFDLQNVLTHELGHALGLPHNHEDPEATMYPHIRAGEQAKRDLALSDERALLALYEGVSLEGPAHGCSSVHSVDPSWLLALLPTLFLRRRVRRQ